MVGSLRKVASLFRPTTCHRGGNRTATLRRREVGALQYLAPSLALLPFFTSAGPDLGAWPDCWVSVEFLHGPIPRKGSGSTTTKDGRWAHKIASYENSAVSCNNQLTPVREKHAGYLKG